MFEYSIPFLNKEIKNKEEIFSTLFINLTTFFQNKKTFVFTSISAHEGKSTIVDNLAIAIANTNKKVLVICADPFCPSIFENTKGFTEIIKEGNYDQFFNQIKNISIIFPGRKPDINKQFIFPENFKKLITTAENQYDYILIDLPPYTCFKDIIQVAELYGAILVKNLRDKIGIARWHNLDISEYVIGTIFNKT